jgi:hypothetical protein
MHFAIPCNRLANNCPLLHRGIVFIALNRKGVRSDLVAHEYQGRDDGNRGDDLREKERVLERHRTASALQVKTSGDRFKAFVQRPKRKPSQLRGGEQVNVDPAQTSPHQAMGLQKGEHFVMSRYRRLR